MHAPRSTPGRVARAAIRGPVPLAARAPRAGSAGLTLAVVVPTRNEARWLPRLLDALAAARGFDRPDEVVVADGGSADGTADLARSRGARIVEGFVGRGAQLAAGARASDAELLVFLHADTRPRAGALGAVRRAFERDPHLVATGMRQAIDAPGAFYRAVERAADLRVRVLGIVYGDSGLGVRRSEYEAVGGFSARPLFEDVDLSRRLRRRGPIRLLQGAVLEVSARRWRAEGRLGATLRNWALTGGYLLGMEPSRLVRYDKCEPRGAPGPPAAPPDGGGTA